MIRKDAKLKLLKSANYQTEKQYNNIKYPDVYANSKYGYNYNSNSKYFSNSKNMPRTSSAFFQRNYDSYLEKIQIKKNFINSTMLREKDLNALLFKLKKYNNEVQTYTQQKNESLKHLKNTLKLIEFKYNKLKELQDIDLPDEKISVKNFNELKMSKADIEQKLYLLLQEKQDIDYSLKNETEYNKTIEYMFEDEQNRLLSIKSETNIIEEKLFNIRKYQKIVSDNLEKSQKKDKNYEELNKKIDNDIKLIDQVSSKQYKDNKKLERILKNKENEIKYLEQQVKLLKSYSNDNMDDYQNDIKEKIEQAKEEERKRNEDERKYIEIIYCLYIIQKYFIDEENFNRQNILSSKEYQLLARLNPEYISPFLDNKKIITENNTKFNFSKLKNKNENKRSKNRALSNIRLKRYNQTTLSQDDKRSMNSTGKNNTKTHSLFDKNKCNQTSSTFFHTKLDINTYYNNDSNNIEELVEKFREIKLTKQKLFDYNSRLLSKLNFYRFQMDEFHLKELKLEEEKKSSDLKVKEIISENYFNFEELTKNKEKCLEFLEKNEYYIRKMKKNNRKKKMNKIIEEINKEDYEEEVDDQVLRNIPLNLQSNSIREKKEKEKKKQNNPEEKIIDSDDIIFKSSKNIIMTINNFFLTCTDLLKEIIISINNINAFNANAGAVDKKSISSKYEEDNSLFMKENITEENNNKFTEAFIKLSELQKNKEIDISNNYKLLLQYIRNLIQYLRSEPIVQSKVDLNEIYNILLDKFYKSKEGESNKEIDKLFVKRFLSKKTPNFNNIFNHFTALLEPTISNIKLIYELTHDNESQKYLDDIIQNKNEITAKINSNKKPYQSFNLDENSNENENENNNQIIFKKHPKYRSISSSKSEASKFEELCVDDEDNDSIDTQSTKKQLVRAKKKVKSIDEKVVNKLYTPFLEKTVYLRKLNPNIPGIKQMTSNSSKTNYEIKKIINDVDNVSYQMKIYNNPALDPNKLCNNTYNSLVKLMLNNNSKRRNNIKTAKFREKKDYLSQH